MKRSNERIPQTPQSADRWEIPVIATERIDITSLDRIAEDVEFSAIVDAPILVSHTYAILLERERIFSQSSQICRKIMNARDEWNDRLSSSSSCLNS